MGKKIPEGTKKKIREATQRAQERDLQEALGHGGGEPLGYPPSGAPDALETNVDALDASRDDDPEAGFPVESLRVRVAKKNVAIEPVPASTSLPGAIPLRSVTLHRSISPPVGNGIHATMVQASDEGVTNLGLVEDGPLRGFVAFDLLSPFKAPRRVLVAPSNLASIEIDPATLI